MKRVSFIAAVLFYAALTGCQSEMAIQNPQPIESGDSYQTSTVEGLMRIKVAESLAEEWLSLSDDDGTIIGFDHDAFPGLDVISVSTSFNIGGRFIERQKNEGLHLWFDIIYNQDVPVTKASEQVTSLPDVLLAEPVYRIASKAVEMNDPLFFEFQWHYDNRGDYDFRPGIDIGLVDAWEQYGVYGNPEVIVGVVDSGVDYTHEDLSPNMWINEAELNGLEGVDDDGNGYKDDIYGYNFVSLSNTINFESHGTHVAGTIAAANNNGLGLCGIAGGYFPDKPGVRMMALQALDASLPNAQSNIIKTFQYAAENGAVILNNSWGYNQQVKTMPNADKEAVDYFIKYAGLDENGNQVGPMKGGLVIFAAGNEAEDLAYPAAYDKVISVASIGPTGMVAYYSNYGEWVDVCAPGGDQKVDSKYGGIFSTGLKNTYVYQQGTSMACPHVAGIAALVLSACGGPGYTCDDLWNAVIEGTDPSIYDLNPDMKGLLGVGMVNASLALSTVNTTPPEDVKFLSAESNANTVYLTADVPADDTGDSYYYHVYFSKDEIDINKIESYESVDVVIGKQELLEDGTRKFPLKGLDFETDYYFAVYAGDFAGNRSAVPCLVSVRTKANTKPVITVTREGEKILKPGESTSYLFKVSDPDDFHVITCTFDKGNTVGVTYATLIDGSHHVKIDASVISEGDYSCRLIASDQFGGESYYEMPFTVKSNSAPIVNGNIPVSVLNGIGEKLSIRLSDYFSDPDEETLIYNVVVKDPSVVAASVSNGNLTLTSKAIGRTSLTISAADGSGATVSAEASVVVRDPQKPFDIYPNPFVDVLNIGTGEDCNATVTLYSSTGQMVYESKVQLSLSDVHQENLGHLAPGRYSIVIKPEASSEYRTDIVKL